MAWLRLQCRAQAMIGILSTNIASQRYTTDLNEIIKVKA